MIQSINHAGKAIYRHIARKEADIRRVKGFTLTMKGDDLGFTVLGERGEYLSVHQVHKGVWLRLLITSELEKVLKVRNPLELMMCDGEFTVIRGGSEVCVAVRNV